MISTGRFLSSTGYDCFERYRVYFLCREIERDEIGFPPACLTAPGSILRLLWMCSSTVSLLPPSPHRTDHRTVETLVLGTTVYRLLFVKHNIKPTRTRNKALLLFTFFFVFNRCSHTDLSQIKAAPVRYLCMSTNYINVAIVNERKCDVTVLWLKHEE